MDHFFFRSVHSSSEPNLYFGLFTKERVKSKNHTVVHSMYILVYKHFEYLTKLLSYLSSVDMFYVLIVWLQKHIFIFHATKWTQSTRFLHSLVPKQVSINDSLHHWYHFQKIYTQPGRMITLHSIVLPNGVIIGPYEPSVDPRAGTQSAITNIVLTTSLTDSFPFFLYTLVIQRRIFLN